MPLTFICSSKGREKSEQAKMVHWHTCQSRSGRLLQQPLTIPLGCFSSWHTNLSSIDTGLLHHFHFNLRRLYVRVRHLVDTDLYTCQHGLTHFTYFHGIHRKFYFCVRCSHTLCPLTHTNIEGHNALYLTS